MQTTAKRFSKPVSIVKQRVVEGNVSAYSLHALSRRFVQHQPGPAVTSSYVLYPCVHQSMSSEIAI